MSKSYEIGYFKPNLPGVKPSLAIEIVNNFYLKIFDMGGQFSGSICSNEGCRGFPERELPRHQKFLQLGMYISSDIVSDTIEGVVYETELMLRELNVVNEFKLSKEQFDEIKLFFSNTK